MGFIYEKEYEIVTLEEKIVAGVSARTNNTSPEMGTVIGGLWNRFYKEGIYDSIPKKTNAKVLGILRNTKTTIWKITRKSIFMLD